jgi:aminoglycoside 2'-N-acetyltransferase I
MSVLERFVRSGYQLGALGASTEGSRLYASRGWQLWRGPISAMTPDGIRRRRPPWCTWCPWPYRLT